jgi:hypothetical protein
MDMRGAEPNAAEARIEMQDRVARHQLVGNAEVRRIGWWRFPAHELISDGHRLALMGRAGWFKIFLGAGQRIELPDGSRWRLRSMAAGGDIVPIIVDSKGRKVALGGASHGAYGINTKDAAFVLYRAGMQRRGRGMWALRHFDDEVAIVSRTKVSIRGAHSVPLGVVLLSFVLARYGLPSDSAPKMPAFTWA